MRTSVDVEQQLVDVQVPFTGGAEAPGQAPVVSARVFHAERIGVRRIGHNPWRPLLPGRPLHETVGLVDEMVVGCWQESPALGVGTFLQGEEDAIFIHADLERDDLAICTQRSRAQRRCLCLSPRSTLKGMAKTHQRLPSRTAHRLRHDHDTRDVLCIGDSFASPQRWQLQNAGSIKSRPEQQCFEPSKSNKIAGNRWHLWNVSSLQGIQ